MKRTVTQNTKATPIAEIKAMLLETYPFIEADMAEFIANDLKESEEFRRGWSFAMHIMGVYVKELEQSLIAQSRTSKHH